MFWCPTLCKPRKGWATRQTPFGFYARPEKRTTEQFFSDAVFALWCYSAAHAIERLPAVHHDHCSAVFYELREEGGSAEGGVQDRQLSRRALW